MNGALRKALANPWLVSTVSFLPVLAFLLVLFWFCCKCLTRTSEALRFDDFRR